MLHSSSPSPERGSLVQTHQIQITDGRNRVDQIRRELFAFPEVLDVFITPSPEALVVVCSGRPHPAEWQRALRDVGFSFPSRRRPTPRPAARAAQAREAERELAAAAVNRHPPPIKARPVTSGQRLLLRPIVR
jgi:hypothetical protein